nr:hypothetical protein [uncultured Bdellovibrio sp.]
MLRGLLALGLVFLSACSTLPISFTTENVMKVHQGMPADEILKMFGKPRSISQAVCGSNTGHPWTCTTWKYGEYPDTATFTFSGDKQESMVLNDFTVDRK